MFISTDSLFSVSCVATHFGMKERDTPRSSIRISCKYTHPNIMSLITTKFHEILLSGFRGVALTNCVE